MPKLLVALIPLAFAAALQPPQVIALIVLLQTRRATANGTAYVAGMTAFRLALGAFFWILISRVEAAVEAKGNEFDILVGAILVVLGLLMLVYALRRGLSAQAEDEAAASWLQKLNAVTPLQAALAGIAFLALDPKDWLIDLSAIDLIAAADLSASASFLAYLAYITMAQTLLLVLLILRIMAPQKTENTLARFNVWLEHNERSIEIIVAAGFGLLFLYTGLERLGLF